MYTCYRCGPFQNGILRIRQAGHSLSRLCHEMMGKHAIPGSTMTRTHLKYVGLKQITLNRYNAAVTRFFTYLKLTETPFPRTVAEIEYATSEYVNFLYQNEDPLSWASTFLSGIRRLCPQCKPCLSTAALYARNWSDSVERIKAFPFTCDMVQGMATMFLMDRKPHYAVMVLVAFSGLFRLGELFFLKIRFVEVVSADFCIISLKHTKARRGTEAVILRDRTVIRLLVKLMRGRNPENLLFNVSYRTLGIWLRKYAAWIQVPGDRFTGHGFRRGGATYFFKKCGSYDRVQHLGRWADARVARSYIDAAVADRLVLTLPEAGQQFLVDGVTGFPLAVKKWLDSV